MKKRLRYPGSKPFETAQKDIFFGRDQDIDDLCELLELERGVVLYGKSGLGKSSLIEAGIVPQIQAKGEYQIIHIRFGAYQEGKTTYTPLERAFESLQAEASWFQEQFAALPTSLWHLLKNRQIHQNINGFLLIFDQFEELFTYPEEQVAAFARQLAEVQYTNIPKVYRQVMDEGFAADENFLSDEQMRDLHQRIDLKTLTGIRSDRMSLMNKLKPYLPEILVHTYELKALSTEQAKAAIQKPAQSTGEFSSNAFKYNANALRSILDYLTKDNTQGIESFQLQIFCEHIEGQVIAEKHAIISQKQIGENKDIEEIYENYYLDKISSLGSDADQLAARELIEKGLIFEAEERRLSLYKGQIEKDYGVSASVLRKLVDSHLLRAEPSMRGGYTYELSHDTLVAPILKAKAERVAKEQADETERLEQERKQELAAAKEKAEVERLRAEKEKRLRVRANRIAVMAGVLLCIALAAGVYAYIQNKKLNETTENLKANEETLIETNKELEVKKDELVLINTQLKEREQLLEKTNEELTKRKKALEETNKKLESAKEEANKAKIEAENELQKRKEIEVKNLLKDAEKLIEDGECILAEKKLKQALEIKPNNKQIQELQQKCN